MHNAKGFAVALRFGLAKIESDALLGVSSLPLTDHSHGPSVKIGESCDHRGVISIRAVAVQFLEALKQDADIIHHVGALRVARQQRALPGSHVSIEIMAKLRNFTAQTVEISRGDFRPGHALQIRDFAFQLFDFVRA
jgi:hypothetical protein